MLAVASETSHDTNYGPGKARMCTVLPSAYSTHAPQKFCPIASLSTILVLMPATRAANAYITVRTFNNTAGSSAHDAAFWWTSKALSCESYTSGVSLPIYMAREIVQTA